MGLSGCASDPKATVVTETKIVKELVEVAKPLPESLISELAYPPSLPEGYVVEDMIDLIYALYDIVDVANADRGKAAELTQPAASEEPVPQ